ncbi:PAS/PAC sensor signal transduction histidine kinase [Magnetococcus marinus MC-1]|uniref:histidine kinase n=1 Tax=Magnetococcus marinus (strain ATCC BAA-1437 / JCM 17883 / MC-1) TaxID=156889 RepID=A0L5M2_MAGMM|nr:ATP-binding protein [Magnetococcus marinus]ABK43265.1 PAS/PAC sensor signal transduction histidine kinase [Magnetococcus marinus MC-1]
MSERRWKNAATPLSRWMLLVLLLGVVITSVVVGRGLYGSATVDGGGDYGAVFLILLYVNLFLVLALGFLVIRNLARLWLDRRRRMAGSQLRTRMVTLFVALSLFPTLVITLLSVELLNKGVDSWFSDQVSQALEKSLEVSRALYRENQRSVGHDAEDMVRNRIISSSFSLQGNEANMAALEIERQARQLDEIALIHSDGTHISRVGELPQEPTPDLTVIAPRSTRALMHTNDTGNIVRAYVRVGPDLFLVTGRYIDGQVLNHMETIESTYVDYNKLGASHGLLKGSHTITLILITLLLVLAAVWSGFRISETITEPITALVVGTRQVADGDLSVSLQVTGDDELATLMRSFNAMTQRLAENQQALQASNNLLEDRRRFMAAVVGNISSGVISVDHLGQISLMNPAAGSLLGIDPTNSVGHHFEKVMPEPVLAPLSSLLETALTLEAVGSENGMSELSVQIMMDVYNRPRTLLARLTLPDVGGPGFIVTFDDLTSVVHAQRSQAWSDVARRIAHEIKNPLTPIQLWAQRMRRRYLKPELADVTDWKVLDEGTQSIIQQVDELKVLVDEFSTFARLPRPDMKKDFLSDTLHEVLTLHDAEFKDLSIEVHLDESIPPFPFDRAQIKQVVTNLLTNAVAAMEDDRAQEISAAPSDTLVIRACVAENGRGVYVQVEDNGPGIPVGSRDRVFEPYFTTKQKGTGLGLAIVKKIIEDHGGRLWVKEAPNGGTLMEFMLPLAGPRQLPIPEHGGQEESVNAIPS